MLISPSVVSNNGNIRAFHKNTSFGNSQLHIELWCVYTTKLSHLITLKKKFEDGGRCMASEIYHPSNTWLTHCGFLEPKWGLGLFSKTTLLHTNETMTGTFMYLIIMISTKNRRMPRTVENPQANSIIFPIFECGDSNTVLGVWNGNI